jgi:hypothetical protein
MKANQRVESLETLSKGARHKRVRRFGSSGRVFTHSFDNAAGWKTSDHSKTGIERGSESVAVAPRKTPIVRRSKNLPSRSSVSSWRLDTIQTTLLVFGSLVSFA